MRRLLSPRAEKGHPRLRDDATVEEHADDGGQGGDRLRRHRVVWNARQAGLLAVLWFSAPGDIAEIRREDGARRRRRLLPETQLTRRLEKRASVRGRYISALLPAAFARDVQVEEGLRGIGEQVVQTVDFRRRVRQVPAPLHHPMEALGIFVGKGDQHGDDRVPGTGPSGDDGVASDVAVKTTLGGVSDFDIEPIGVGRRRQYRRIEHGDLRCEPRDGESRLHLCEPPGCDIHSRFGEHVEPHTEASRVEPFVARAIHPPQVEVEERRHLPGRRQRQQVAAVLQPAVLNHVVKEVGWQVRDRARQLGVFGDASEQLARARGDPSGEAAIARDGGAFG